MQSNKLEKSTFDPITINYVDAAAGSGKTYTAIRIIDGLVACGDKFIYAAPTKDLIDEVFDQFSNLSNDRYNLDMVHEDTINEFEAVGFCSASWIADHSFQNEGALIVLSHSALMLLINNCLVDDLSMWHLVVDEEFAGGVTSSGKLEVSTEDRFTNLFNDDSFAINDDVNSDILILPHQKSFVDSIAKGKSKNQDYLARGWQSFSNFVINPLWQVHGKLVKNDKSCVLQYVAYLKPSLLRGFASIKILSADLEESLLYLLWLNDGVEFRRWAEWEREKAQGEIRKTPSGEYLTIHYLLIKDDGWRTNFLETVYKVNKDKNFRYFPKDIKNKMVKVEYVTKHILDRILLNPLNVTTKAGWVYLTVEPLLRVNNPVTEYLENTTSIVSPASSLLRPASNDEIFQYRKKHKVGGDIDVHFDVGTNTIDHYQPLPANSAGLNAFKDSHKVVYLQAQMPLSHHEKWLKLKGGLTKKCLRRAYYHAPMYQAVMRCSLRDPSNTEPKTVIVGDKGTAEYLLGKLSGAMLHHLPIDILEETISFLKEGRATRSDSGSGLTSVEKQLMVKVRGWVKKFGIELKKDHGSDLFKITHKRNLGQYLTNIIKIYGIDLTDAGIKKYDEMDKDPMVVGKGRRNTATSMREAIK